jgi:DNA-binding XRE family transcriptional regulator
MQKSDDCVVRQSLGSLGTTRSRSCSSRTFRVGAYAQRIRRAQDGYARFVAKTPIRRRVHRPAPTGSALRELGSQIRKNRLKAGLTMEAMGTPYVTRAGVSQIERGKSAPSYRLLLHFSRRLGVSVRRLIPPNH